MRAPSTALVTAWIGSRSLVSERIEYRGRESRHGKNVHTLCVHADDVTDRELVEFVERAGRDHNSFGTHVERYIGGTARVLFYTD